MNINLWKCVVYVLGILEPDGTPEHIREQTQEYIREGTQELGGKESPKVCISPPKSWTPLHAPLDPFYRETNGLLHSESALGSKEYFKLEHVYKCLLHPVICGANFKYSQVCHLFTPWTQTYDVAPLTRFVRDSCFHSWRSLSV
jgi:hypothetical protein